ncbi:MAG: peptide chain release factor N(5)-glutamine methyltransferase [Bacteroidetes bacterium]|nr:peptide chain release factor N(5)-glutamine methyltransferase [Bacteroidota bacterium]MBL6943117.1 peptide chain release factor N(5)-glutamine methyltransferase [Bacteroidales bacterium]
MEIRNNILGYLKKKYVQDLFDYYDEREAEQLLSILIEHFFSITRNELILNPDYRLSESEILKLHMAVKELKKYRPVQYITGVVEFHGLKLEVNPDVLIPRPETEELVKLITDREKDSDLTVLDIGTGSGCIAIGLKSLLTRAHVNASDISQSAINIAQTNADANYMEVAFQIHDILNSKEPIRDKKGKQILFDIIVSNPPYVTQEDKRKMHQNVLDYEPHSALFVTDNKPLKYYEAILNFSKENLKTGGRIYFEINESRKNEMVALMNQFGYSDIKLVKDLRYKSRFVFGSKKNHHCRA